MSSPPRFTLAELELANDEWGCNCGPGALAAICGLTLDEVRPHFANWPGYTNPTSMFAALRSVLGGPGERWRPLRLVPDRIVGERYKIPTAAHISVPWPIWGLLRVQWEGPWTRPGVPPRARYRYTHWVGAARRSAAVSIHPEVSFGRPVLAGTGVRVDVVEYRHRAGDSIERLAHDYQVDARVITDAIAWHRGAGEVGIFDINVLANGSGWCSLEDWSTHVAPVLAKDHDRRATGSWHVTHAIEVAHP